MTLPPRLLPDEPLPRYAHVPGRTPHPHSDPAGHSFGVQAVLLPEPDPLRWQDNRAYLRGLDLFNAQFYWESHEAWEALWMAAGRTGATADFLKGLIKLAAAGVKQLEGRPEGVRSHARRAAELLRAVAGETGQPAFMGLQLQSLIEQAEGVVRHGWPDAPPVLWPG